MFSHLFTSAGQIPLLFPCGGNPSPLGHDTPSYSVAVLGTAQRTVNVNVHLSSHRFDPASWLLHQPSHLPLKASFGPGLHRISDSCDTFPAWWLTKTSGIYAHLKIPGVALGKEIKETNYSPPLKLFTSLKASAEWLRMSSKSCLTNERNIFIIKLVPNG